MRQILALIASIAFGCFVCASVTLIYLVATRGQGSYMLAAFLAMVLTMIVTMHCKSEVRDLTPLNVAPNQYVAGKEEADEWASAEQLKGRGNRETFSVSDVDFDE
jgi:hypothetical protein